MSIASISEIGGDTTFQTSIGQSMYCKTPTDGATTLIGKMQANTHDGGTRGHASFALQNGGAANLAHKIILMLRRYDMDT